MPVTSTIKDVAEFSRLFRVRIPVEAHFDYYIDTLSRSAEFADLPDKAARFAEFEKSAGMKGAGSLKMENVLRLRDLLQATEAWKNFSETRPPRHDRPAERTAPPEGALIASLDLSQANYNVFRYFDLRGKLPGTFEAYCEQNEVPALLPDSKSFRQLVFGRLDSKRNQAWQQAVMKDLMRALARGGIPRNDLFWLSTDECGVVLDSTDDPAGRMGLIGSILGDLKSVPGLLAPDLSAEAPVNFSFFRETALDDRIMVRDYFLPGPEDFRFAFRSLHHCPGSLFFYHFKKEILKEPFDPRDLLFYSEGKLARWAVEDWQESAG